MELQRELPGLNYAALTGVIKKRRGINLTRTGIPVIHLIIENTVEPWFEESKPRTCEIHVDIWGRLATVHDEGLKVGAGIFAEGVLVHREVVDIAGGVHFQNVLKARRIQIIAPIRERKA